MTIPYLSPAAQFGENFRGAYQQGYQGFLGQQARQQEQELEERHFAQQEADRQQEFARQGRLDQQNQDATGLARALGGVVDTAAADPTQTITDPMTGKPRPRWQALQGTSFSQDYSTTPDYQTAKLKADQAMRNSKLGDALAANGAPAGIIAAARSGSLDDHGVDDALMAPYTASLGAKYREPPAGTVADVPVDPNNPTGPTRKVLIDPRTGQAKPIQMGGQPLLGAGKVTPPNAADRKDASLAGSVTTNTNTLDAILNGPHPPSALDIWLGNGALTRPFASSAGRQAANAAAMMTQDLGHLKAGARLPPAEYSRAYNSLTPQVGDDDATLRAKAAARQTAKLVAGTSAGVAPFGATLRTVQPSPTGQGQPIDPFQKYRGLIPPPTGP